MKSVRTIILALAAIVSAASCGTKTQPREVEDCQGFGQYIQTGWMGGTEGLIKLGDTWHMYTAASGMVANKLWGHATSSDLLHWNEQAVALSSSAKGEIRNGNTFIDSRNSAGFGDDAVIAFYTVEGKNGKMTQNIAYSQDGNDFSPYEANPVLEDDVWDAKVLWYAPTRKWIMYAMSGKKSVNFYSSDNLKDWTFLSTFSDQKYDGKWMRPELFPISNDKRTYWTLAISNGDENDCDLSCFLGNFNGEKYKPVDHISRCLDYGDGFKYASSFEDGNLGRKVMVGGETVVSIPREIKLVSDSKGTRIVSRPVREVYQNAVVTKSLVDDGIRMFDCEIAPKKAKNFEIVLSNADGEEFVYKFNCEKGKFTTGGGFKAPLPSGKSFHFEILLTDNTIQCFLDRGEICVSDIVSPKSPFTNVDFRFDGRRPQISEKRYGVVRQ